MSEKLRFSKEEFQDALGQFTMCGIQHDGWTCNTCFHSIEIEGLKEDIHKYWLAVLSFRGDYPDLPPRLDLIEELYNKMWKNNEGN